ncbi:MAG: hypothetical protein CVV48_12320 [Spirochaetae bacterium HGW-Spirochaetae-4]|nr:MAG: hypothetical protein CVV48_12320 [Spirochaetae bacterium HGW-Spirochaetae-4]
MRTTVLFGDSLTAGRIGLAFRRYMPVSTEAHGIEGDTWLGVAQRAQRYLAGRFGHTRSALVLQGGANDLLIPHMMATNDLWKSSGSGLIREATPPVPTDTEFLPLFTASLAEISRARPDAHIIVCSIPILGEDLDSELNVRRRIRNAGMESVVGTFGNTVWCDITTVLEELIHQHHISEGMESPTYLLDDPNNLERDVRTIGTDETKAETISKSRRLAVTIDGVHPNGVGAQAIASAITAVLPW